MPNSIINSDNGVVSGQSGLKTSGGDDGVLALQNNGTTNVAVTAAGLMGVGTTSPQQKLHVAGATSTYTQVSSSNAGTGAGAKYINATSNWILGAGATSGLGRFEIADQTGSSVLRVAIDTSGNLLFNSGYGSAAIAYGCRAWVNFDGVNVIRASGGVSSVFYNGTGNYTVTFSFNMPDVYYAATCYSDANSGIIITQTVSKSTTQVQFYARNGAGTFFNGGDVGLMVVR
jgi:hypothetical protein